MKTALLVMVHGSPTPQANAEMYRVVDMVKERNAFEIVAVGFLECNEPRIPDAIAACVDQGAERIVAVPYFLHTGAHVAGDLPSLLEEARERHPHVAFALGRYIGSSPFVTDALRDRIREAAA